MITLTAADFINENHIQPVTDEREIVFGIQGGKGSFNEEALRYYMQQAGVKNYRIEYLYTSDRVVEAVLNGSVNRGQCAIFNSTGGFVDETVNAIAREELKLLERFAITIAHALMIRPDSSIDQIDTIMCHPQVLAQCKGSLAKKYPHLKQTSGTGDLVDNARVAEALASGELGQRTAIMGSKTLAEIYGLNIIEDNLQDQSDNFTHFLHVTKG